MPSTPNRTASHETPVAILGGGVAGLSLALALTRAGVGCRVYERSLDIGGGGMGFILMPDGLAALERLGCADAVRQAGATAWRSEERSASGAPLAEKVLPEHVCILRRALLPLLFAALPDGIVRQGIAFAGFDEGEHRAARLVTDPGETSGETVTAAAYVGADGKRSRVREALFPAHRVEETPVTELINGLHAPNVAEALRDRLLKFRDERGGLAVGLASVGEGEVVWYVQFDRRAHPMPEDEADAKERFARRLLRGWPEPLPDLIRRTDFSRSYLSEVVGMATLPRLYGGDTVLVGDAAHPLPTLLGQGANAAVCDAVLLADALLGNGGFSAEPAALQRALTRYDRRRLPEVDALHREGRARVDAFTRSADRVGAPPPFSLREPSSRATL
ncbi:MAG: NAD(P)/FAD-dependent oxidoreductase [Rhodothermales bacterium]